jgi:ABC-type nickel/cobalt efflux system permease component RcnA
MHAGNSIAITSGIVALILNICILYCLIGNMHDRKKLISWLNIIGIMILITTIIMVSIIHVIGENRTKVYDSGKMISVHDAVKILNFDLAPSATNIWFYEKAEGLQSLDSFIRIEVDVSEISNQIELIISDNNRRNHSSKRYDKQNLNVRNLVKPHDHNAQLIWWTPERITNGFYRGEIDAYCVQIWVDESNGQLFIHQGD